MTTFDSSLFAKLEDGTGYDKTNVSEVLNPYVNFYHHENTQTLQDVLVAESIQMRGVECYYLPSEFVNKDELFGEDPSRKFNKAWKFAAYLDSFEGYSGGNSFFSKFGMSVNDEVTITINPNLFKHQVNGQEPKEGDLFYFAMDKSLFEITWVEPYNPFYQVGSNAMRRITAQKFVYSGEEIKPVLQYNEGINIPEFSELDLDPVHALNDLHDIKTTQYVETDAINDEGKEIIEPYVVVNNKGIMGDGSPFDDFV
ncbi:neck protein [Acinetobacter phage AB-Navy4]|nr:neck protein [Acinetobacter phage AB-Navy4]